MSEVLDERFFLGYNMLIYTKVKERLKMEHMFAGGEINLSELKRIELEILTQIHEVCVSQNIRYTLGGGTLLGAVRHGGFIPWDDDIDILMPRPDYNRFIDYCQRNHTPFVLISNEITPKYSNLFAKAIAPNTVLCEMSAVRSDVDMGVFVDIFPIDGLGNTYEQAKKLFAKSSWNRELLVAYNWKKFFRSKTRSWIYEPIRFAFYVMSRGLSAKKLIGKIQAVYPESNYETSDWAGVVCGVYRLREILPAQVFAEYEPIVFEGKEFIAIKEKETYLRSLYGDYMQLPPKEKQNSHHTFQAYYKTEVKK